MKRDRIRRSVAIVFSRRRSEFMLQINWTAAVETLLRATGLNEQDRSALLLSDMPVSLQCRDFLPELSTLLSTTSPRYRPYPSPLPIRHAKKKTCAPNSPLSVCLRFAIQGPSPTTWYGGSSINRCLSSLRVFWRCGPALSRACPIWAKSGSISLGAYHVA